ncbi:MAG: DUF3887 domain-containing protein [Desulfomonile tiedjei]|uniref:DUF3887 domain-containing protein n=1 Tax=Desulfomonile tiedjei TaxID=2358 RepID=A0A9D6Z7K1_9BACT|nr:DUF3887 domain-containing protein [Desulfomonile tiedjei]
MHQPIGIFTVLTFVLIAFSNALPASADRLDAKNVKTQSSLVLEGVIRGISEGDYDLYSKNFSQAMKAAQTREVFLELQRSLQKNLGKFKSVEYVGFLNQYNNVIAIFKARFTKEQDDIEIRVVLEDRDIPKVTGLWFDAPALNK